MPVYKGGGKDPLLADSYRGVTLSSIIEKVLERALLARLMDVLEDAGLPHTNQTAYQ